ncbi:HPP family protein [Halobacteriaceae archaeon GCM10025711]
MFEGVAQRYNDVRRRLRRLERREVKQARRWLETTSNLTRVSVLLFVPFLIGLVTFISNTIQEISFLLFPPLASGTYTLFAEPEGRYSSPRKFVSGMTLGAISGWLALELSARFLYHVDPGSLQVHAGAATLGILLTGGLTWLFDVELPTAFSTALLVLLTGSTGTTTVFGLTVANSFLYAVGIFLSASLVAGVFVVWREKFYEQRARYLYQSTQADDHVLVPMRGETASATAMFGARLAAAHDAGKVVLLDVVNDESIAEAERTLLQARDDGEGAVVETTREEVEERAAADAAERLEAFAHRIETQVGVPSDVVVAVDGDNVAASVRRTAEETNCDLVVAPYQADGPGGNYITDLFRADLDVVAFRSADGRTRWKRIMVPVRRAGDVAHAMIDFAERLAGKTGSVSVCTCIDREDERRQAEGMLANLAETTTVRCETRVSRSNVEEFVRHNDAQYDLVFLGASTDRSTASRLISRPTFERLDDVTTDVAIVHRG